MPTPHSDRQERTTADIGDAFSAFHQSDTHTVRAPRGAGHLECGFLHELIIRGPLTPAVPDRAMTCIERQQVLDRAWRFVDTILALGKHSEDPTPRMMGIEIEGALTHHDGSYAVGEANPLLSMLDSKVWHDEAGSGSVEFASPPIEIVPGSFAHLLRYTQRQFNIVSELAAKRGLLVIGTGIVPVLEPDQVFCSDMGAPSETEGAINLHWEEIERQRAMRQGGANSGSRRRSVSLEYGTSTYEMTTDAAAWMTINSLHVTFQTRDHDDALNLFNALRALTPLMLGASCNTGLLNGHELKYQDYRPKIIAGSGPMSFNFNTCTGLVCDKAESLRHAFELVMPQTITDPCPMISLKSGEVPSLREASHAGG